MFPVYATYGQQTLTAWHCTMHPFTESNIPIDTWGTCSKTMARTPRTFIFLKVKVEVKSALEQATMAQRGRYSPTLSLISALDGVGGQRQAQSALPPGMNRCPPYRKLGGPQGRSGRVQKISPLHGFDPRTVQPVAIRYTDYAVSAHLYFLNRNMCK